jgi:light-regulated signal transduction histidine kinase (bacteriophytochrome)
MEDLNETVDTLKSLEKKLASKNKELENYTYTVSHDLVVASDLDDLSQPVARIALPSGPQILRSGMME